MSDVEKYWQAIATKYGDNRTWHHLTPNQQAAIIHSINIVLGVLNNRIQ
jgi:hypothetical protein